MTRINIGGDASADIFVLIARPQNLSGGGVVHCYAGAFGMFFDFMNAVHFQAGS